MRAKGKSYLKITGVLMIIFGVISAIIYLIGSVGGGLLIAGDKAKDVGTMALLVMIIGLIWAVFEVVAGVMGVKNCENPQKADACLKMGIILIIFAAVSNVAQMVQEGFTAGGIGSLIVGLLLPVLYCYGAKLNKE